VAFVGYVAEPEERALYVLDLSDGSVSKIFTLEADHQVGDLEWSPDGNSIGMLYTKLVWTEPPPDAGARDFDLIKTIWTISPDGSNLRQVTTVGREDGFTWSPDGTRIAFSRHAPIDGDQRFVPNDIYVVDADGTNEIKLTDDGVSMAPAWSPDGTMIAFESYQPTEEPNVDLYVMLADGTGRRRLTDDPGNEFGAAWSPDGALVVYAERAVMVDNTSSCYISVVALDGSRSNRLFGMRDVDGCPGQNGISWQALPASGTPAEPERSEEPGRSEQDIGLGFPVCNVTSVGGTFESGVTGTAYVATKAGDTVCPQPGDGMQVLAVDINADGLADTSYGPLECDRWCTAFATPDVDGDGMAEILVQNVQFSIVGLKLFEVQIGDGGAALGPVTVARPGSAREGLGFEPGAAPQLWLGGDAFDLDTLRCEDSPDGRVLVYTTATQDPPDSSDSVWRATATTFSLNADFTVSIVDVREFAEPVGTGPPSFQSGETLCGSNLGPSQA
jgi:dipeptidyl aminopeptidase/acylaminoacyl peptidase